MLAVAVLLVGGCISNRPQSQQSLSQTPFDQRHVWAVLPLLNESGSLNADGLLVADQLARHLENVPNLDMLSVNRVLAKMQTLGMDAVNNPAEAMALLKSLGADGLVVGVITSYDPYDPPKLGMTLELYALHKDGEDAYLDIKALSSAAVASRGSSRHRAFTKQPVVTAGGYFDASDPPTRELLEAYATDRGSLPNNHASRLHRINMDLFSEFVCYVMCKRVLYAQTQRLAVARETIGSGSSRYRPDPLAGSGVFDV
jgi:hypothetical protein